MDSFATRLFSSRPAIIALAIVCALVVVGLFDAASNWGKAYGNVSINGVSVGGMTADEMRDALKSEFGSRVSHAQITIYASEESKRRTEGGDGQIAADDVVAEQLSVESANETLGPWSVDALSLKANVPYDRAIEEALSIGRDDGGIPARLGLLISGRDVPLDVEFDKGMVEALASEIDQAIGDPRVDATVAVEGGIAEAVEGKSGTIVSRSWLVNMISRAMIGGDVPDSFVAQQTEEQSRITFDQATDMANSINRAIEQGAMFSYDGKTWLASPSVLGDWIQVSVAGEEGNWKLEPSIMPSAAIPVVVDKVGAEITSDDVVVTFGVDGGDVSVHTEGTGNIPEVSSAIDELQKALFGENGIAWGSGATQAPTIEVTESDRPESMSFDDAVNMGVITVIGEYTTEFSDIEGTENRNHNIKLAADILDNGIIEGNGGTWSFNDRSGNTNEEAGFWTAGSIVDGEYVDSVGGGICQVATTIFNSVLEAGLEVLERHNHTLYIASYPTGRDAAVDYPSDLDLTWKNGLESDVLLKMSYTDTSITAQLYSVYTGYSSDFELGNWEEGKKYSTLFEKDDSLGEGSYYRKTVGEDGSKILMTRTVTDDKGANVRIDAFESNYDAKDEVYVIGPNVDTSKLVSSSSDSYGRAGGN